MQLQGRRLVKHMLNKIFELYMLINTFAEKKASKALVK
jgi:hypothetical protein